MWKSKVPIRFEQNFSDPVLALLGDAKMIDQDSKQAGRWSVLMIAYADRCVHTSSCHQIRQAQSHQSGSGLAPSRESRSDQLRVRHHEITEVVASTKTAGWRIQAGWLITPTAIEGMLVNGQ